MAPTIENLQGLIRLTRWLSESHPDALARAHYNLLLAWYQYQDAIEPDWKTALLESLISRNAELPEHLALVSVQIVTNLQPLH